MNVNNLKRLKTQYGLAADLVGGHLRLTLPYPKQLTTAIGLPPSPFESDEFSSATKGLSDPKRLLFAERDAACEVVANVFDTAGQHASAVAALGKDGRISDMGRAERAAVATTEALAKLSAQFNTLKVIGRGVSDNEQKLFAVPTLDAVSAIVDMDVRRRFYDLSRAEQLDLLKRVNDPSLASLLLALKRDPMPLSVQNNDLVSRAWATKVEREQPEAVATWRTAHENFEWASAAIQRIAKVVTDSEHNLTLDQFNRAKQYEVVKPLGAADLLSFTEAETVMHDRRLETQAA